MEETIKKKEPQRKKKGTVGCNTYVDYLVYGCGMQLLREGS